MTQRMKLAVETQIVNKIAAGDAVLWEQATSGFENVEMTQAELAEHINHGYPFCVQHKNRRREANFLGSDILAVDIDRGWRVEEALSNTFVQQQAAILYTTPTHTEAEHRFRIVFQLPRTITDVAEMRLAYTGIVRKFGGDKACKDACHFFFGSKDSNPVVFGNIMSTDALDELLILAREEKMPDSKRDADGNAIRRRSATRRSEISLAADQQVRLRGGWNMPVADLPHYTPVHCPIHIDVRPSAFIVHSQDGVAGVHCRACDATFWPPRMKTHSNLIDFYQIEDVVSANEYREDPTNFYDDDAPAGLIEMAEADRGHFTFSTKYLDHLDATPRDGVTFVRSPKGSGKTEWLSKVVDRCRGEGKSVLLVGHRRTLLNSMAERLGLTCYYYMEGGKLRNEFPDSYYAICLDSVGKLLNPRLHRYDVVIIDESEQVISHLTGDTMRSKRRECALKLFHYLRSAKSVIVSDADLGQITVDAIFQTVSAGTPYRFYLNTYRESRCPVYFYEDDGQLVEEMLQTVQAGGRHYIATNSKNKAEVLAEALHREAGQAKQVLLVTSDTVSEPDVMQFINNVKSEFLRYDVVIASPTMGTGIDITFPDNAQLIDNVFGFFEARVNTHFDIDQQIARVRHPKAIRVWVAPQRFGFETDPNVIRQEAEDNGTLSDTLLRILPDGRLEVDETYLSIYAHVVSVSRASKNRLRENLRELRERNGWQVETVSPTRGSGVLSGKEKMDAAKTTVEARRIEALCVASKIEHDKYRDLRERISVGMVMSRADEMSMRRHEIELFYRTDITPDLAALDDRGTYREKVRLMQIYLTPLVHLKERAMAEHDAHYMATDKSYELVKKLLLHDLLSAAGIADDVTAIRPDACVSQETLGRFAEVCQRNASKIQELFGLYVRRDVSTKAVRQLRDILNLIGIDLGDAIRQKRGGVTTNIYEVDEVSWETVKEIVDRRLSSVVKAVPAFQFQSDLQRSKRRKKEKEAAIRAGKRGLVAIEY